MFAVAGTGFVNPGTVHETFPQRVGKVVAAQPDLVVVAGGQNDLRYSATKVVKAARSTLTQLQLALPNARIVLAPLFSVPATAAVLTLRDDLRALATELGVTFIDPTADQWLSGPRATFIGSDAISPTDAGHAAMARLAEPRLRALEIPARQSATQPTGQPATPAR
jgi:lysophospholipase L1-like esterase